MALSTSMSITWRCPIRTVEGRWSRRGAGSSICRRNCWGLFKDNLFSAGPAASSIRPNGHLQDNFGSITAIASRRGRVPVVGTQAADRCSPDHPVVRQLSYSFAMGFDYGDLNIKLAGGGLRNRFALETSPWIRRPGRLILRSSTAGLGGWRRCRRWMVFQLSATNSVTWLRTDFRGEIGNALGDGSFELRRR